MEHKVQFVPGGHRNKGKSSMVHTASTMRHSSVKLLLGLASALGLELWTKDIKQAYFQCTATMQKDIIVKAKELMLGHNDFLKLALLLYGLSESGDYGRERFRIIQIPRKSGRSTGRLILFDRRIGSDLYAVSAMYANSRRHPPSTRMS